MIAIVIATVLPFSGSHAWWIRALDFPRVQIFIAATVLVVPAFLLAGWERTALLVALAACLGYQAWRIVPYTPLYPKEVRLAQESEPGDDVTFLAANILMQNDRFTDVRELIRATDPDVLLLMETNQRWIDEMGPVLEAYSTVIREPLDNHYGLVFATRLKVVDSRVIQLTAEKTPMVFAEMETQGGNLLHFVGLHPKPPVPGEDTEARDAQIIYAARFARKTDVPLVAMGDFNDAAWSDTAQRFKTVGGYVDPRVGRGLLASFDAKNPLLRVPIDQIYITADLALVSFGRGPYIGSDHFPMIATVRLDRELASRLNREIVPLSDAEEDYIRAQIVRHEERMQSFGRDER